MSTPIPVNLRKAVIERANRCCEYCGKPQVTFFPHEVDHIIAEKHGGKTILSNLAYACFECNRHKGSDIASIDPQTGELQRLFHPRRDLWNNHFQFDQATIIPFTGIGRVTVKLLHLNDLERVEERIVLKIGITD